MKEGQNHSTSGFRSNRKFHQHAVHQRAMTPYQTPTKTMTGIYQKVWLQFFLTDLANQKAILGYPWFTANQPKIDWA